VHCDRRPPLLCLVAVTACVINFCAAHATAQQDPPLLKILDQFTASDVPARGPNELPTTRNWWDPTTVPSASTLPAPIGNGLAQHPMLYAGEGFNTLFLINHGKVIWTYSTGRGGELDDVWLLSNGHVLFTRMSYLEEVTPQKKVVWHYDAPSGTEIHTCQPIGLDKVLFVQNGLPPKAIIINKTTGKVELEHPLPAPSETDPKTVHPQFRRFRMTAAGTYLGAHLNMGKVIEYDKDFQPIWTYEIKGPWSAARLKNGNTLINSESGRRVVEVDRDGKTIWEFNLRTDAATGQKSDLPDGILMGNNQTAERLANGETVICASTGGARAGDERIKRTQVIEVRPDKKIVWTLRDWTNLGPATTVQLLDEPGVPENPGDLQR
jgi:outer membrane protein assembly factor BamB